MAKSSNGVAIVTRCGARERTQARERQPLVLDIGASQVKGYELWGLCHDGCSFADSVIQRLHSRHVKVWSCATLRCRNGPGKPQSAAATRTSGVKQRDSAERHHGCCCAHH
jgi:hypothetical protein